jgi:hypothetical protein
MFEFIPEMESLGRDKELIEAEHNSCYNSLSEEDKDKFDIAETRARNIVKEYCQKNDIPYTDYNFYLFSKNERDKGGSYTVNFVNEISYINILIDYFKEWRLGRAVRSFVHELIHAIASKNHIKYSDKLVSSVSGLRFDKFDIKIHDFSQDDKKAFLAKLNNLELDDLNDVEIYVLELVTESANGDQNNAINLLKDIIEENISKDAPFVIEQKIHNFWGLSLDESITDYIAAKESAGNDNEEFEKNINEVYIIYISWVHQIITKLNDYEEGLGDRFYKVSEEAKRLSSTTPIIKFFNNNLKLKISPKRLLNFDEELVKNILDNIPNTENDEN